jgi:hypothetical protein
MAETLAKLKGCIAISDGRVQVKDGNAVKGIMDELIYEAVFNPDEEKRKGLLRLVIEISKQMGAVPASIQSLYEEMGRSYPGFTGHAINERRLNSDGKETLFNKTIKGGVS